MRIDPIVEKVRQAGIDYIASLGGLKAAVADLQRRTEEARRRGRSVIAAPKHRPRPTKPK